MENACPHLGAPLSQGWLRDGSLTCPWHGSHPGHRGGLVGAPPAKRPARGPGARRPADRAVRPGAGRYARRAGVARPPGRGAGDVPRGRALHARGTARRAGRPAPGAPGRAALVAAHPRGPSPAAGTAAPYGPIDAAMAAGGHEIRRGPLATVVWRYTGLRGQVTTNRHGGRARRRAR
ncbi:Rieske 2Fe-2S domain-containing protein [Microbispora siamensis]